MRGIYKDETPVGFVLLHVENLRERPERPDYYYSADGSAEGFYERFGFEHTGAEAHGELEMRLAL